MKLCEKTCWCTKSVIWKWCEAPRLATHWGILVGHSIYILSQCYLTIISVAKTIFKIFLTTVIVKWMFSPIRQHTKKFARRGASHHTRTTLDVQQHGRQRTTFLVLSKAKLSHLQFFNIPTRHFKNKCSSNTP